MSHKKLFTPRTRAIALLLVMVTLIRFSQAESAQEELQASIFGTIHDWVFGSSSASSTASKPVVKPKPAAPTVPTESAPPEVVAPPTPTVIVPYVAPVPVYFTVEGYRFPRTIRTGMKGDDVLNLQLILNRNPLTQLAKTGLESPGEETGTYDYKTRIALIAFQKLNFLTDAQKVRLHREQGVAGLTTRQILEKLAKELVAQGKLPSDTANLHAAAQSAASSLRMLQSSMSSRSTASIASTASMSSAAESSLLNEASVASQASSAVSVQNSVTSSRSSQSVQSSAAQQSSQISSVQSSAAQSSQASLPTDTSAGKILTPGTGFTGATPQPNSDGDTKVIARWDVVPYQTFTGNLNIGVVAFHSTGIQKVSFSVNGGAWKDVTSMSVNSDTGVNEYWATLRASDFADGQLEVRAIAYPTTGIPRVLQGLIQNNTGNNTATSNGEESMWLFANAGGGLQEPVIYVTPSTGNDVNKGTQDAPVKTLIQAFALASATNKDGAHIILTEAGQYYPDREAVPTAQRITANNTRWITVEPASNLTREQVEIVGIGEADRILPRIQRLHWKSLTIRTDTFSYINESTGTDEWYDHSLILSIAHDPADWVHWRDNIYATDSRAEGSAYGFIGAELVRNCVVKNTFDAYQRSQLVINSSIERQRQSAESALHHPDFYQTWGEMKNVILYGITGDDIDGTQVIFINQPLAEGPMMSDAAFVDWNIKTYDLNGGPPWSQLQGPMNNVYFKNVNIPNQKMVFRTDGDPAALNHFEPTNIVFEGCTFHAYLPVLIPVGVTIR